MFEMRNQLSDHIDGGFDIGGVQRIASVDNRILHEQALAALAQADLALAHAPKLLVFDRIGGFIARQ